VIVTKSSKPVTVTTFSFYLIQISGGKVGGTLRSVRLLLVTANVPSSPICVALKMEALRSSETSVPIRAARRNISEDAIIYSYSRENLKSYNL
jgi:hypothetical protein